MLAENGFIILNDVYTAGETEQIKHAIEAWPRQSQNFRQSADVFAIRQVFREIPGLQKIVFTANMQQVIRDHCGNDYFLVKAIYFDKPALSNWFVSWHQDLSIAVDRKASIPGYNNWTQKNDQYNVQPPAALLESVYTVRIHLDDCNKENGALFVIPGSHRQGVSRSPASGEEFACEVNKGGIMIMQPLLWHASRKSTINSNRRVLHLEFCNRSLPEPLHWAEKQNIF